MLVCALYIRCALSIEKYGKSVRDFSICFVGDNMMNNPLATCSMQQLQF
jgi:hypothetical protein